MRFVRRAPHDRRLSLVPFLALSLSVHFVAFVELPQSAQNAGSADSPAAPLQRPLEVTVASVDESAHTVFGAPNAAGIAVTANRREALALPTPVTPRGEANASGASTMAVAHTLIESMTPFWETNYGAVPPAITTPPQIIDATALGYPTDLPPRVRATQTQATIVVAADGRVEHVVSVEGPPAFARYMAAALRDIRFRPAEQNGKPVRYFMTVTADFVPAVTTAAAGTRP